MTHMLSSVGLNVDNVYFKVRPKMVTGTLSLWANRRIAPDNRWVNAAVTPMELLAAAVGRSNVFAVTAVKPKAEFT